MVINTVASTLLFIVLYLFKKIDDHKVLGVVSSTVVLAAVITWGVSSHLYSFSGLEEFKILVLLLISILFSSIKEEQYDISSLLLPSIVLLDTDIVIWKIAVFLYLLTDKAIQKVLIPMVLSYFAYDLMITNLDVDLYIFYVA